MRKDAKIYVAGQQTLIGRALHDHLLQAGFHGAIAEDTESALADPAAVDAFFARHQPEYVFLAAGRSGGIAANMRYPAELIRDNLLVNCNVIHAAYKHGVRKLLYLASSCSYPRLAKQPIAESALLTGPLESTNEAYAVAKIAGIKLCQAYRQQYGVPYVSVIPANAFGPHDDYRLEESHVIAALMHKMHEAKVGGQESVKIWGSGSPRREFIFARDLADACCFVMDRYDDAEPLNLGTGTDLTIKELAETICTVVQYAGKLEFDASKPDGMPRKALDSTRLNQLGWRPQARFEEALAETYAWFVENATQKELAYA